MLAATLALLFTITLTLAAGGWTRSPTEHKVRDELRFQKAHRRAVELLHQNRHLQRLLTRRVLERNKLRRALRQKIALVGGHPLERGFLCIHSHEGSWTDPNPPYWGGVQMDMTFQRTYGPEFLKAFGTADHWPVSVQIAVAIRAYISGRGYGPWPTRRYCGL